MVFTSTHKHLLFVYLLVWATGATDQSDDEGDARKDDAVCKVNGKPLKLLFPHTVKGFKLRGANLDKKGNQKNLCVSPGEDPVISKGIDCRSPEVQLWNIELFEESPGKSWFKLISNSSGAQCLTLSSEGVMTLEKCDMIERGQWWALMHKEPGKNQLSTIKPGHNLLVGLQLCKCLRADREGELDFGKCPQVFSREGTSPVRYWVIERTKPVPCNKRKILSRTKEINDNGVVEEEQEQDELEQNETEQTVQDGDTSPETELSTGSIHSGESTADGAPEGDLE